MPLIYALCLFALRQLLQAVTTRTCVIWTVAVRNKKVGRSQRSGAQIFVHHAQHQGLQWYFSSWSCSKDCWPSRYRTWKGCHKEIQQSRDMVSVCSAVQRFPPGTHVGSVVSSTNTWFFGPLETKMPLFAAFFKQTFVLGLRIVVWWLVWKAYL